MGFFKHIVRFAELKDASATPGRLSYRNVSIEDNRADIVLLDLAETWERNPKQQFRVSIFT